MEAKDTFFSKNITLNCKGQLIDLSSPKIMGVLNITPDSFYAGSRVIDEKAILNRMSEMINEGADMIDIGAYSSRPGAQQITVKEEIKRLEKALIPIRNKYPDSILSVDTFRSEVAKFVVDNYDVDIINDISAGDLDAEMYDTIAELGVPYIIMHMLGTPDIMQDNPVYENVVKEICLYFSGKINLLKQKGIHDIIIDPGFGFGKTVAHNYELLNKLDVFKIFELPVLIGISRKSMIYKVLEITPEKALNGTTVLHTLALINGANILRVHDVAEAKEAVKLIKKYICPEEN